MANQRSFQLKFLAEDFDYFSWYV